MHSLQWSLTLQFPGQAQRGNGRCILPVPIDSWRCTMMNCHRHHHHCGCANDSYCPYPQWMHPLLCNPTHYCCTENADGPTLVIHKIVLESGCSQSCTPRNFTILITGPSYPAGESFTLRAGSCTELDEPLVIAGLIPGTYYIEEIHTASCCCGCCSNHEYDTTITGPVCGNAVNVTASSVPVVITIVSRKRLRGCRRRRCCQTIC